MPARTCPRSKAIFPSRLASPTGDGTTVFSVIPSTQPGSSTSVAASISRSARIVKRDMKKRPLRTRSGE